VAFQKFGEKLADQQKILAALSDLIIDRYLGESAVLPARSELLDSAPPSTFCDSETERHTNLPSRT